MKPSRIPWLGNVPEEWEVMKVGYLLEEINKRSQSGQEEPLSMSQKLGIVPSKEIEVANPASSYVGAKIVSTGDLVLNKLKAHLGVFAISRFNGLVSPDYAVYRAKEGVSVEFLNYVFHTPSCISEFKRRITGVAVGFNRLYTSDLFKISVPLPPLPEQRKITVWLDAETARIDNVSGKIAREIERLGEWKKSFISEAVAGRIEVGGRSRQYRDSGIPWLGNVPEAWEVVKISSLYDERCQKVSERDYPALSVSKLGVVPQMEHVAKSNDVDNRKLVCKGDFAINSRSDRRGACGIAKQDGSVSLINIVLKPRSNMDAGYFDWLFHTEAFADEFYKWGHGIDADVWSTHWTMMKKISVPLPPLSEQREIAALLDAKCAAADAVIAKRKAQLERLDALKRSLIAEAVTGKKAICQGGGR